MIRNNREIVRSIAFSICHIFFLTQIAFSADINTIVSKDYLSPSIQIGTINLQKSIFNVVSQNPIALISQMSSEQNISPVIHLTIRNSLINRLQKIAQTPIGQDSEVLGRQTEYRDKEMAMIGLIRHGVSVGEYTAAFKKISENFDSPYDIPSELYMAVDLEKVFTVANSDICLESQSKAQIALLKRGHDISNTVKLLGKMLEKVNSAIEKDDLGFGAQLGDLRHIRAEIYEALLSKQSTYSNKDFLRKALQSILDSKENTLRIEDIDYDRSTLLVARRALLLDGYRAAEQLQALLEMYTVMQDEIENADWHNIPNDLRIELMIALLDMDVFRKAADIVQVKSKYADEYKTFKRQTGKDLDDEIIFVNKITPVTVQSIQAQLNPNQTDQHLKFLVKVDAQANVQYPLSKGDEIFIGHFRDDRASFFTDGLLRNGYTNLSGYVLYNKKYKDAGGYFILPEDVLGPINNTFFDILSEAGIEVRLVSENEKKKHVAKNAHGRKSKLGANEKQVSFDMQESNQEYADTPQMRTVEITDQVIEWLDNPWVDFILANLLSSDMMKHTGNYQSALKGNKITDENLGRIIRKVNRISKPIIREIEKEISEATREFPDIVDKIGVYKAAEFLEIKGWFAVAERIRKMAAKAPILVLSADHGASEDGLKAKVQESTTAHTANPVPYIIYDLLNPRITLQEGRTIRNNAATLLHLMGMDIPDEYESSLIDNSYKGQPRRIVNLILDGWGINPDPDYEFNAIKNSKPENYNWLVENASFVPVAAHGEVIGLRKNLSPFKKDHHSHDLQPGATDIGHFSHFAGRLKKQAIVKVDEFINGELSTGIFDANNEKLQPIVKKMKRIIKEGKKFHHIAVGSEGGVHSCLSHMFALMRMAKALGMEKDQFVIHFIADGRDVGPITADLFLSDVYEVIEEAGIGVVGTFFGRTDLVRKDGFEHITNRIISILEGDVKKFTVNSIKKYTITSEQASENEAAAQLTQDGTQIDPENSLDKDAHLSLKTSI